MVGEEVAETFWEKYSLMRTFSLSPSSSPECEHLSPVFWVSPLLFLLFIYEDVFLTS